MNPWKIIADFIGWTLIALMLLWALRALAIIVWQFALDCWDARGDLPEKMDYTSTSGLSAREGKDG